MVIKCLNYRSKKVQTLEFSQHADAALPILENLLHGLRALLYTYYSPACGLMVGDERITGLKIHEQTQQETKLHSQTFHDDNVVYSLRG